MDKNYKNEIYDRGFERGYNIASWQDLPEIGTEVKPFEVEDFVGTIETIEDSKEIFISSCFIAEENDRQFSPFEFTANEFNKLEEFEAEEAWDIFESAITDGVLKNWEERKNYYND